MNQKPDAALPEVAVADADPATRAIYEQIRRATGVGTPALVYRHMAVYPGLLDWVWRLAGPEIESGHVVRHAVAAVEAVPAPALPLITAATFDAAGVDANGQRTVRALLATYNRMNPVNAVVFTVIRTMLTGGTVEAGPLGDAPEVEIVTPAPLPRPLDVAAMPADLQATVRRLSEAIPAAGGATVTPTLYRHFAIWPDFMRAVAPGLQAALDTGAVQSAMAETVSRLQPLIADVLDRAHERGLPTAPIEDPMALARTLDSFLVMIPQLIVIGRALDASIESS